MKTHLNIAACAVYLFSACFICSSNCSATGYVHASGTQIVNGNNTNLLLKGIGTGNWMIQEGYMMQSSSVAGTQWQFKQKLTATIGAEKTTQFYTSWLDNHFRKIDVDSMAHWGFNSVRPALHYKVFTLPIEEEPIQGENTWLEEGFVRLDSLVSWCAANQMYVIFDLHGAPGGQGKDANISDYDASKPSLWESELNKSKTVALWRKIAERYATNKWVAGYDLLNETNWTFTEGNNAPMRALYGRITTAIREVDPNHMIIIEGNWFANDYTGLTPKWDNNMAYSFHKYWAYNTPQSADWIVNFRNNNNCPVWLGETGENSNRWFTDCIELMEKNNIGWSFWPVKKSGNNNILKSTINADYKALINYWVGTAAKPTVDKAFQAVMTFSENHKLENCTVLRDVLDAMTRQPYTNETLPFKPLSTASTIFAVDYDLGRAGYAYSDTDDADYHVSTNTYTNWNNGYNYRNDGVDIEGCTDTETNGYNVGWINNGEWLQYTIQSAEANSYTLIIRHAAASGTAKVHIEIDGKRVSKTVDLTPSGSWTAWKSTAITNVIVPAGKVKMRIVFEKGGANFNYFQFKNPKAIDVTAFELLNAQTDTWANVIKLKFNKRINTVSNDHFQVSMDGQPATLLSSNISESDSSLVELKIAEDILKNKVLQVDYSGNGLSSGTQNLTDFGIQQVENLTSQHQTIPGKIEAEAYSFINGFNFETCADVNAGLNTADASKDRFLDYYVNIESAGTYTAYFRVSVNTASAQIALMKEQNGSMIPLKVLSLTNTGGWQNWQTQSFTVSLPAGKNKLRLLSRTDGYNLNWFQFSLTTAIQLPKASEIKMYPNPTHGDFNLTFNNALKRTIQLFDMNGRMIQQVACNLADVTLNTRNILPGVYIVKISDQNAIVSKRLQII